MVVTDEFRSFLRSTRETPISGKRVRDSLGSRSFRRGGDFRQHVHTPAALRATVARVYGRLMIGRTSLEALYSRYSRSVWRRARRILADDDAAKDVTQEVFLRAMAVDATYAFEARPIPAWLYGVTTNLCLNKLRERERANLRFLTEWPLRRGARGGRRNSSPVTTHPRKYPRRIAETSRLTITWTTSPPY